MANAKLSRIERCPQCGFRFRGRVEDHQHLSPRARKLQRWGFVAIFPSMLGVVVFLHLTRGPDGRMIDFPGFANSILMVILLPSLVLFVASMLVAKHATYRCPQCSWQRTLRPGDVVESVKDSTSTDVKPEA